MTYQGLGAKSEVFRELCVMLVLLFSLHHSSCISLGGRGAVGIILSEVYLNLGICNSQADSLTKAISVLYNAIIIFFKNIPSLKDGLHALCNLVALLSRTQ